MPKLKTARPAIVRKVVCVHCGGESEVARRAMSVFCIHCKNRLILEDFTIRTYHATKLFATCGDIVVEKAGTVFAPIRAQNLTVRGQVQGNVLARDRVQIANTGKMRGDIRASRLVVAGGGVIDGFCHIEPSPAGTDTGAPR